MNNTNQTKTEDLNDWLDSFEFTVDPVKESEEVAFPEISLEVKTEAEEEVDEKESSKDKEEIKEEKLPKSKEEEKQEEQDKQEEVQENKPSSFYKNIAEKYLEKGRWNKDLVIETDEGVEKPITEILDTIDEDLFFQIEEVLEEEKRKELEENTISLDKVDSRRKELIEIIKSGGDLDKIFQSKEQIQEYINPFQGLDLKDERVQEQIYLNALIKYNKLDEDAAKTVVEKAKKDLTLDLKVQSFVDQYNSSFENYVAQKKQEIIDKKKKEEENFNIFRKEVNKEVKELNIQDALSRKLVEILTQKNKDGDYLVDEIYSTKMEDPKEAIELALFLQNKEAYLEKKMEEFKLNSARDLRKKIKISTDKAGKIKENIEEKNNEFEYQVKV